MAELWSVDFSTGTLEAKAARAAKFYHTPRLLGSNAARLTIGAAPDGVTGMQVGWGEPPAGTVAAASFTAAVALGLAEGAYVNIYDADPAKHGLHRVVSGVLTRQGRALDRPWLDHNHGWPGGFDLALWIQSWATNAADTGVLDDWGPGGFNGWPYVTNLRGLELHARMRALDLKIPRETSLVQHIQMQSRTHGPAGVGVDGNGDPITARAYVNAFQQADLYSDALKLGRGGLYARNAVDGVHDSGWVDVAIRFSTKDSDWFPLGALPGREGLTGGATGPYRYVVDAPDDFLQNPSGVAFNAYIVSVQPVMPGSPVGVYPENAYGGRLLVQHFKLIDPAT